jgi:uncharacterized protein
LQSRYEKNGNAHLIDHHITAIHFNDYPWGNVKTEYGDGRKSCATSLFYEYLIEEGYIEKNKALDEFVELVRQYDTWEWEENGDLTAKRLNDLFYIIGVEEFENRMIERLNRERKSFRLNESENTILELEEKKIERYINQKRRQMKGSNIGGYYVGVVHAEQYHSEVGNVLGQQNKHLDYIALVNLGGGRVSFRSIRDHVDLSEVAKEYGGGGHQKSAGASLTDKSFFDFVVGMHKIMPRKVEPQKNKYNIKNSRYGTVYENYDGQYFSIVPNTEKWSIICDQTKREEFFSSFEEAENALKVEKGAWLSNDDVLISMWAKKYGVNEQTLRSQFERTMKKIEETYKKITCSIDWYKTQNKKPIKPLIRT